jgi:hypothetical protein
LKTIHTNTNGLPVEVQKQVLKDVLICEKLGVRSTGSTSNKNKIIFGELSSPELRQRVQQKKYTLTKLKRERPEAFYKLCVGLGVNPDQDCWETQSSNSHSATPSSTAAIIDTSNQQLQNKDEKMPLRKHSKGKLEK